MIGRLDYKSRTNTLCCNGNHTTQVGIGGTKAINLKQTDRCKWKAEKQSGHINHIPNDWGLGVGQKSTDRKNLLHHVQNRYVLLPCENLEFLNSFDCSFDMNTCFRYSACLSHFWWCQLWSVWAKKWRNVWANTSCFQISLYCKATVSHKVLTTRKKIKNTTLPGHLLVAGFTSPHVGNV